MISKEKLLDLQTESIRECQARFNTKHEREACIEGVNIVIRKLRR